jgi:Uncharacterized protein conserved in bacteria
MDSPRQWLRYVDASDLDNSTIAFDGITVDSPTGEELGEVDGAIVDVSSGRPYYVVVNAGGWFKSKYFLLPIGHIGMTATSDRLIADIGKDRVERFPGFDRGEFEKLSDDELNRMAGQMVDACCPSTVRSETIDVRSWTTSSHYVSPIWWKDEYYRPGTGTTTAPAMPTTSPGAPASFSEARERDREAIVAHGGDVSPHAGGRAQPGDVIGIETGGEETHIGDTSKDENDRRRDTEKTAAKRARD